MHHIWVLHLMEKLLTLATQFLLAFQPFRGQVSQNEIPGYPLDAACSHSNNNTHKYYSQVQGLVGVTGARWCDFVVYTSKGMSIEPIPFDEQYWNTLKVHLSLAILHIFLPRQPGSLKFLFIH